MVILNLNKSHARISTENGIDSMPEAETSPLFFLTSDCDVGGVSDSRGEEAELPFLRSFNIV